MNGALFSEHLECRSSLGMENGNITDTQITASSEWQNSSDHLHAYRGRLHLKATGDMKGAWAAGLSDVNQWLQVDLRSYNARVTGVATQGREDVNEWVKKYKLQFSFVNETTNFQTYLDKGQNKEKASHYAFFSIPLFLPGKFLSGFEHLREGEREMFYLDR